MICFSFNSLFFIPFRRESGGFFVRIQRRFPRIFANKLIIYQLKTNKLWQISLNPAALSDK